MARSDSRRGWRSMTDLVSERATERPRPAGAPDLPDGDEQPADRGPARPGGVELTRLIALARLTPAQALEIGASVLADLARHLESGTGADLAADRVVVGADGRAVFDPTGDDGRDRGPAASGAAAQAVLAGRSEERRVGEEGRSRWSP